jgi:hypothetical protein
MFSDHVRNGLSRQAAPPPLASSASRPGLRCRLISEFNEHIKHFYNGNACKHFMAKQYLMTDQRFLHRTNNACWSTAIYSLTAPRRRLACQQRLLQARCEAPSPAAGTAEGIAHQHLTETRRQLLRPLGFCLGISCPSATHAPAPAAIARTTATVQRSVGSCAAFATVGSPKCTSHASSDVCCPVPHGTPALQCGPRN